MRQPFIKGQKKLSAKQLNYMQEAANAVHDSFLKTNGAPLTAASVDPAFVMVKNVSGESLWSFSILAITGVEISEETTDARSDALNANVVLEGNAPTGKNDVVAVTFSAVNQDELVHAVLSGPAYCLIDVLDTSHRFAVPVEGDCTKLESAEEGNIRILGSVEETGERFLPILLGSPATGSGAKLYAVVMEAIRQTPDPTVEPEDYVYGKIRIVGKEYPPSPEPQEPSDPEEDPPPEDNSRFDDCCLLGGGIDPDGDNHQQLIKGDRIEINGPHKRKNPDYDPEDEESDEPEYLEYYEAEPIKTYKAVLDADIESGEWGTFNVEDGDGNSVVMACSGEGIEREMKVPGNAEKYDIELIGHTLYVNGGPCAVDAEDQ